MGCLCAKPDKEFINAKGKGPAYAKAKAKPGKKPGTGGLPELPAVCIAITPEIIKYKEESWPTEEPRTVHQVSSTRFLDVYF